jgi:hypothetical protein
MMCIMYTATTFDQERVENAIDEGTELVCIERDFDINIMQHCNVHYIYIYIYIDIYMYM